MLKPPQRRGIILNLTWATKLFSRPRLCLLLNRSNGLHWLFIFQLLLVAILTITPRVIRAHALHDADGNPHNHEEPEYGQDLQESQRGEICPSDSVAVTNGARGVSKGLEDLGPAAFGHVVGPGEVVLGPVEASLGDDDGHVAPHAV